MGGGSGRRLRLARGGTWGCVRARELLCFYELLGVANGHPQLGDVRGDGNG